MASGKKKKMSDRPLDWLPFDSRLLPPILCFDRVRGIARCFLIIEIGLATMVVLGTLTLAIIRGIS